MNAYESWRPIPGFEGDYEASSIGRVRSTKISGPRVLSPFATGYRGRYLAVKLSVGNVARQFEVQVLVALAFHGPRPADLQVRHLDGDPHNNAPVNLKYGTPSENSLDRRRHGTDHNARKEACDSGHPFDEANTLVISTGHRRRRCCRECNREAARRYRDRKQAAQTAVTS